MVLIGCGYRTGLLPSFFDLVPLVQVWEHTIDGYVSGGEDALVGMRRFAETGPVCLHSLDLSIGSPIATERPLHLQEVRALIKAAGVDEIGDHLSLSRIGETRTHDFVPLWRVEEQLELVVRNVDHVQHALGVPLALENVASFFDPGGDIGAAEFSNEVVRRTGCHLLLDISNLLINEVNGFCDAAAELSVLDLDAVTGVHLAGGEIVEGIMWDAHHNPVPPDVRRGCRACFLACRISARSWWNAMGASKPATRSSTTCDGSTPPSMPRLAPPRPLSDRIAFDGPRVAASPAALDALRGLGVALSIDRPEIEGFALGYAVARAVIDGAIGRHAVDALVAAGAVDDDILSGSVTPRFTVADLGAVRTLVPRDPGDAADRVYFGVDSLWLHDLVHEFAPGGDTALDLGCGTGFLGPLLCSRYRRVVLTDVLHRTVATAAGTLALNGLIDRHDVLLCTADAGAGLRHHAFDVVATNPPWVPDHEGEHHFFEHGGRTGWEKPARFLLDGVALLRAGGVLVMLTVDVVERDGSRPLHRALTALHRAGYHVDRIETPATSSWPDLVERLVRHPRGIRDVTRRCDRP